MFYDAINDPFYSLSLSYHRHHLLLGQPSPPTCGSICNPGEEDYEQELELYLAENIEFPFYDNSPSTLLLHCSALNPIHINSVNLRYLSSTYFPSDDANQLNASVEVGQEKALLFH